MRLHFKLQTDKAGHTYEGQVYESFTGYLLQVLPAVHFSEGPVMIILDEQAQKIRIFDTLQIGMVYDVIPMPIPGIGAETHHILMVQGNIELIAAKLLSRWFTKSFNEWTFKEFVLFEVAHAEEPVTSFEDDVLTLLKTILQIEK